MLIDRRQALGGVSLAATLTALGGCKKADRPSTNADLIKLDGIAQAGLIKDGHMSATEAVEAALERIATVNPTLNAFVDIQAEQALDKARNIGSWSKETPYAGLPYALKDLNEYPGMKYQRGSAMFADAVGENKTPYTQKIDDSGVIVLGKTATPKFGLLGTTEPLASKPCHNPWDLEHSAGGSSGGSAAAVAARVLPMAQASDGGGSIRNPASQCGLVGLKPSRGRFPAQSNAKRDIEISIKHCVSLSVRDTALMLALTEQIEGRTDWPVGLVNPGNEEKKRIAVTTKDLLGQMPHPDVAKAVDEAAKQLEDLGHEMILVDEGTGISPTFYDDFIVLWGQSVVPIVQAAEKMSGKPARDSGLLEGWTMDLAEKFQEMSDERVALGMKRLTQGGRQINQWLSNYDAWLTPSAASPAPKLGWTRGDLPYEQNLERSANLVAHFSLHNVAGTPGISLPWGQSDGLPIGIQLSGPIGGERALLELAYQIEEAKPWIDDLPPVVAG
jgi:amidase